MTGKDQGPSGKWGGFSKKKGLPGVVGLFSRQSKEPGKRTASEGEKKKIYNRTERGGKS